LPMLMGSRRAIGVCALLDRFFAVVFCTTTPEQHLSLIVSGFQFKPDIKAIDRAGREEVSHLARAHYNVHALRIASAQLRQYSVQRSGDVKLLRAGGLSFSRAKA